MKLPKNIPSTIGVYVFTKGKTPIYIGKAVNLRARVRSHFEAAKISAKEAAITSGADKIKVIKTPTEFQALVLESQLIQKHHPKYNVRWKDDKSYLYIKVGDAVKIVHKRDARGANVFGPFASTRVAEQVLRGVRRVVPFHSSENTRRSCFYKKIGLCDRCPNSKRTINKVRQILRGHIEPVLKGLRKRMNEASRKQDYETALALRNKVINFDKLIADQRGLDADERGKDKAPEALMKLLKLTKLTRIECYDISNLSQKEATASMVVWQSGTVDKSQYRKFKVKNEKRKGDVIMLEEILKRRFKHKEWPKPDLLVVDGGKPQVRAMLNVKLKTKSGKLIPVIGIAKNPDRLVLGKPGLPTLRLPLTHPGFNLIRLLRDESHRFAKKYHIHLRHII